MLELPTVPTGKLPGILEQKFGELQTKETEGKISAGTTLYKFWLFLDKLINKLPESSPELSPIRETLVKKKVEFQDNKFSNIDSDHVKLDKYKKLTGIKKEALNYIDNMMNANVLQREMVMTAFDEVDKSQHGGKHKTLRRNRTVKRTRRTQRK
jgi:hypothetical protein